MYLYTWVVSLKKKKKILYTFVVLVNFLKLSSFAFITQKLTHFHFQNRKKEIKKILKVTKDEDSQLNKMSNCKCNRSLLVRVACGHRSQKDQPP